jgi:hypothetical protein
MTPLLRSALLTAALFACAALAPSVSAQDAAPRIAPFTVQVAVGGDALLAGYGADVLVTPRWMLRAQQATGFGGTGATVQVTRLWGARRARLEAGGGILIADTDDFESGLLPVVYAGGRRQPGPGGLMLLFGVAVYYDGVDLLPLPGVAVGLGIGKPRG